MATKTSNYEFNKPEQNDFYDVDVQNENWDKVDEELSEFDDSGVTEDIKSFPDFLSKFVTGNKVAITLRNLKAGLQFVLHAGQIVNNCVTDNAGLPLSAAQGKALMDKYTQLYSEMETILQYSHTSDNPFDFNDKNAKAGFHRLGAENSFKNAPSGVNPLYSNVLVVRNNAWDTLSMTIYLYTKGINSSVIYKTGNTTEWANLSWNVFATKSDLLNFKTFQISIKTNTVKDGESQMYHGNVKISDDKNCPPNTVCIIPYGARLETDASRAGIISYRATDTFCAVSHPTISNKNFIVTVLAIYKS